MEILFSCSTFNISSRSCDIKLNTWREIPYLQAVMYYPFYVNTDDHKLKLWSSRFTQKFCAIRLGDYPGPRGFF